jgi:hypothetical protein
MPPADGVWICLSCRFENLLIHYRGSHPFKHLTCGACDAVFSQKCKSSNILKADGGLSCDVFAAGGELQSGCELRAGSVCPTCGLTHRAVVKKGSVSFDAMCPCGSASYEEWVRFSIGSPKDYRRDPATLGQVLLLQRFDTIMN